jgi:hypothetical protein
MEQTLRERKEFILKTYRKWDDEKVNKFIDEYDNSSTQINFICENCSKEFRVEKWEVFGNIKMECLECVNKK